MLRQFLCAALCAAGLGLWSACSGPASTSAPGQTATVLARYAGETITLQEFETRYARSVSGRSAAQSDSVAAYEDFLERYVNFKLKVKAARAAGLDTTESFRAEVRDYRLQMAKPRLESEEVLRPMARQLYERRQTEVDVSHILIRVGQNAAPEDTMQAYQELQALVDSLERGASFGDLALRHSDDPSASRQGQRGYRGRLGYLTAGQTVSPFENRMYSTPEGERSDIFRTQFGYHVLTVHDRRERPPEVRLSHLFIRPDGQSAPDSAVARRTIDSLRTVLAEGAAFAEVAERYSDDRRSASQGGDLGFVNPKSEQLPDPFVAALDTVETVGAVTDVIETRFGYHLLKITDRRAYTSFEDAYPDLKEEVSRMPRVQAQTSQLGERLRRENGMTVDTSAILQALDVGALDSSAKTLRATEPAASSSAASPRRGASPRIAAMGDSVYTLSAWRQFARTAPRTPRTLGASLSAFLNERAMQYAAARLEASNPTFAEQMQEYREGVLLFQFMEDSVWTRASQDTARMRQMYEAHPERYQYPERVRVLTFRASADTLLAPYAAAHASGTSRQRLATRAAADSLVLVDTTRAAPNASPPYRQMQSVQDGTAAGPLARDGEWLFLIRDARLPARPKSFSEARSDVLQDTQDALEDDLIRRLRARYHVETYPERLRAAFQSDSVTAASTP